MPSDSDYLEAVNSGDTATAQRMVDDAAKAAGYTIGPVYHGTPTGGFNVFDKRKGDDAYMVVEGVISEAKKLGFEVANEQSSGFGSEYVTIRDPESNREWKMRFSDHERQLSSITKHKAPNFEQVGNLNLEAAVSWLRKKRETLNNPPKFDQKKYEEELQSKAQSEVKKYEQTVRDLEANRDKRIAQGNDQKAANIQSQIDQIKNSIGYKSALNQVDQFRFMPSPDSAMPGAYSFPGGYRAIPGKAKGSLRLYGPAGSLIGIAASLDEAQRIIRKKSKQ
jgi:hypothetical protein